MAPTVGTCPQCRMTNSFKAVNCLECGTRLPWADEAEKTARQNQMTQASVPVQTAKAKTATASSDDEGQWWHAVAAGVFFLALAGFFYWYFTDLETVGGVRRIKWYIALAYNIGGKWPIIVITALVGFGGIGIGIADLLTKDK